MIHLTRRTLFVTRHSKRLGICYVQGHGTAGGKQDGYICILLLLSIAID
ncbi:hypothetical protein [Bacillus mycoides]|nr:hypothetical protein [Bacillus mycoides]